MATERVALLEFLNGYLQNKVGNRSLCRFLAKWRVFGFFCLNLPSKNNAMVGNALAF
jgi:hypothetical protein